jgi:hypothetical protein
VRTKSGSGGAKAAGRDKKKRAAAVLYVSEDSDGRDDSKDIEGY